MAFPPHRRVSFRGIFGTVAAPYEQWTFRLNFERFNESSPSGAAVTSAAVTAFTNQIAPRARAHVRLTEVKFATIGADGKYTEDPFIAAVNVPGTSTAGALSPPQVALAVSLNTPTRGPMGKGRFYIPAPATTIDPNTGLISVVDAQWFADGAAAFLTAMNAIPGLGNVGIASTKGLFSSVNSVRVGRVLDTIRSRRNAISEAYLANVAVAPSS
jgi:hypothetical protein